MAIGFIYKTTNLVNNKQYIGKRVIKENKYDKLYLGSGTILKQAILKNGRENFKREILEYCDTLEDLVSREIYWIELVGTLYPKGYNINPGGAGGDNVSCNPRKEEIKAKQRASHAKRDKTYDPIRAAKISQALTGRKRSPEECLSISRAQMRPEVNEKKVNSRKANNKLWHTVESKAKIGAANKGRKRTEESKRIQSERQKGKPRPLKEVERLKKYMTDPNNKVPCELCQRKLNKNNYKQHFKKCRQQK